jgi:hypothetical protein
VDGQLQAPATFAAKYPLVGSYMRFRAALVYTATGIQIMAVQSTVLPFTCRVIKISRPMHIQKYSEAAVNNSIVFLE